MKAAAASRIVRIARELALPIDVVTQTLGILAIKRAGKSYTARKFAEQLLKAEQQVVIVDPKGDWWGIRSAADGKSPGIPVVIIGGEHGDIPLEPGSGELIGKLVAEERVSAMLDLSLLRKGQVATFMTGFLETLYRLKAKEAFRTAMMLVIDEADAIAPQRPMKGEERMLGAAEDIVRRGGQRGIGCMMVTQRAAVLNKNVLTQVEILIALRTLGSQDLDAMNEWIRKHGNPERQRILMESLPSLPTGDAWVWSPLWPGEGIFERVRILPIETFDSGATPKAGERRIQPKNLADVDLAALSKSMAATIERAKADDPRELRKHVESLRKELSSALRAPAVSPVSEEELDKAATHGALQMAEKLNAGFKNVLDKCRAGMVHTVAALRKAADELEVSIPSETIDLKATIDLPGRFSQFSFAAAVSSGAPAPVRRPATQKNSTQRPATTQTSGDGVRLDGAAQRVLDALAELEALGVKEPPRVQVAFMAGYTNLTSKGFTNAMGSLRTGGLISYPGPGTLSLTDAGRAQAHPVDAPRSSRELQDRLIAQLGGSSGKIVRELVEAYPDSLDRQDLAARAGYGNLTSKGFTNAIGRLRSLGFIDYPSQGRVAAQPVLFLER